MTEDEFRALLAAEAHEFEGLDEDDNEPDPEPVEVFAHFIRLANKMLNAHPIDPNDIINLRQLAAGIVEEYGL